MRTQELDALERLGAYSTERERLMALDAVRKGCSESEARRLRDELVRTRQQLSSERLRHQKHVAEINSRLSVAQHEVRWLSDLIEETLRAKLAPLNALRVKYASWVDTRS